MKLLALDTASDCCSVALWLDGEVSSREARAERGHGGHVLALIDALLAAAGTRLSALDAIAFGCGPGAFTGVRLAASITQGLAYASGLPVIGVSDLRAVAQRALEQGAQAQGDPATAPARVLVCHDARMGEAYWAGFEIAAGYAQAATSEAVSKPEQLIHAARLWLDSGTEQESMRACGAGCGFAAYPALVAALAPRLHPIYADLLPHAREIAALAAHEGLGRALPPEQALPVYVRNDVAVAPKTVAP